LQEKKKIKGAWWWRKNEPKTKREMRLIFGVTNVSMCRLRKSAGDGMRESESDCREGRCGEGQRPDWERKVKEG
jgi:hypothetical protein